MADRATTPLDPLDPTGENVIGLVLLRSIQVALNDTRVFEATEDPGTAMALIVAPRGLPWRGRYRVTVEPLKDHDPAIMSMFEEAANRYA